MISLLLAYFGKGRIPDSVRYILMAIGLSIFVYKIRKTQKAYKEAETAKEALAIKYAMDLQAAEDQTKLAASPAAKVSPNQTASSPVVVPASAEVSPQTLAEFFLS